MGEVGSPIDSNKAIILQINIASSQYRYRNLNFSKLSDLQSVIPTSRMLWNFSRQRRRDKKESIVAIVFLRLIGSLSKWYRCAERSNEEKKTNRSCAHVSLNYT